MPRYAFALVTVDEEFSPTIEHVLELWPHEEAGLAQQMCKVYGDRLKDRVETLQKLQGLGMEAIAQSQSEVVDRTVRKSEAMIAAYRERMAADAELEASINETFPEEEKLDGLSNAGQPRPD